MPDTRPLPPPAAMIACLLLAMTACGAPPATSTAPPATTAAGPLPPTPAAAAPVTTGLEATDVSRATISGVFAAPLTLTDGMYEGGPAAPGAAMENLAVLMTPLVRLGDLDGHPGAEAVALIGSNGGRSAERISLAIVGRVDGKPVSLATALVGDRIRIRDVRLDGRDVRLDVVEQGPGDEACCGSQLATRTYRFDGATLAQVSSELTGRVSLAATVAGTPWSVMALDGDRLTEGLTPPTLAFTEGRVSGTTGCNPYTASVSEPKPATVAVGPPAGGRRTCSGAAGETERRFLGALAKATSYTFLAGRLVLSGLDGDQRRSITLTRAR